jgi:hypothetical protein
MAFPDELLRGISNSSNIDADGYPAANLFYFTETQNAVGRADGFRELSICWRDDDGALQLIFLQKKDDGTVQFKGGAAVLSRGDLDRLCSNPIVKPQLAYERREIPGNRYHGNLLLSSQVTKSVMKRIAAGIALCAIAVRTNPSD